MSFWGSFLGGFVGAFSAIWLLPIVLTLILLYAPELQDVFTAIYGFEYSE